MQMMIQPADGSAPPRVLLSATRGEYWPGSFSADGRWLTYYSVDTRPGHVGWEVWLLPLDDPASQRKLADGYEPQISPDGRWLAYESSQSGSWEIYLQSFPEPTTKLVISRGGGTGAAWSRDGRTLYYWDRNTLMAVEVKGPARADVGLPEKVFDAPGLELELMRRVTRLRQVDGGFLTIGPLPGSGIQKQLNLAVNWLEDAERKIAGK
jgi:hypothetical protein